MAVTEKRKAYLAKWRAKNRVRLSAINKKYREANREKTIEANRKWRESKPSYFREYAVANRDSINANYAKWLENNREAQREYHLSYYHANKAKLKEQSLARGDDHCARVREWRKRNPGMHRAQDARREASKIQATPKWLTKIDMRKMSMMYSEAALSGLTVDHIVPLRGKKVCGLHVPWNLGLLTNSENSQKSNSMPPDHECIAALSAPA